MNHEYILTEDNPMLGVKGLLKDYDGYKNIAYMNRCLFQKISPDHDFVFEATWQHEGFPKSYFKFESVKDFNHFLHACARDHDAELIYFSINAVNSPAYFNWGKEYFTFTRLQ
jgi:hypothetical protein